MEEDTSFIAMEEARGVSSTPIRQRQSAMTQYQDGVASSGSRSSIEPDRTNRLMDRGGRFHQSHGRWNIRRVKVPRESFQLYLFDPFHTIINLSSGKVLLLMATMVRSCP